MTLSQGFKKSFPQQYMLGDFEYLFLNEYFGLEIWHTCYQHKVRLMAEKQFVSPWEGIKVGNSEIFPHNTTCW